MWLDIGAGGGRYALPLALAVREVVAIDPSPSMLAALTEDAAANGIENTRAIEGRWPIASSAQRRRGADGARRLRHRRDRAVPGCRGGGHAKAVRRGAGRIGDDYRGDHVLERDPRRAARPSAGTARAARPVARAREAARGDASSNGRRTASPRSTKHCRWRAVSSGCARGVPKINSSPRSSATPSPSETVAIPSIGRRPGSASSPGRRASGSRRGHRDDYVACRVARVNVLERRDRLAQFESAPDDRSHLASLDERAEVGQVVLVRIG